MNPETMSIIAIVVAYVIGYISTFVYIAVTDNTADFMEIVSASFFVGLLSIFAMVVFKPILFTIILLLILFSKLTYFGINWYKENRNGN